MMNTKTFTVWFLLLAAVVLAVAAQTSVDNKKQGEKQVEIPTVEGKTEPKDNLMNQGDVGVEAMVEDHNYEADQYGGGWRGGGGGYRGGGGGWRGGGGGYRGGGGGYRGGGGGYRGGGGGWRGGGGGWRGGGGGW